MDAMFSHPAQPSRARGNMYGSDPFAAAGYSNFDPSAMFAQHQQMMRSLSEGSFGHTGFMPGFGMPGGVQVSHYLPLYAMQVPLTGPATHLVRSATYVAGLAEGLARGPVKSRVKSLGREDRPKQADQQTWLRPCRRLSSQAPIQW